MTLRREYQEKEIESRTWKVVRSFICFVQSAGSPAVVAEEVAVDRSYERTDMSGCACLSILSSAKSRDATKHKPLRGVLVGSYLMSDLTILRKC